MYGRNVTKTAAIFGKTPHWYQETLYASCSSLRFLHRLCKQGVNYCIAQAMFIQARGVVYETKVHTHTQYLSFDIILPIIQEQKNLNELKKIPISIFIFVFNCILLMNYKS